MIAVALTVWSAIRKAGKAMTEPGTWKAILVACALAAVAYGTYGYVGARQEAASLSARLSASEAQVAILTKSVTAANTAIGTRNELLEQLSTMETDERAETIKALEANPDWAKQPIPADVLRSLRK